MKEVRPAFDDADAYERYMGQWSRAVGEKFLDWLGPPRDAQWLDLGCGGGAFGELIAARCAPRTLSGIDPSAAQIESARQRLPGADLRVGDAMDMPFADGAFDVVASALVLHFIPDRAKAFAEMKRVVRRGGIVAGYTWERTGDFEGAPSGLMLQALLASGIETARTPTVPEAQLVGLRATAEAARLEEITLTQIEVTRGFRDFDEFWEVQTLQVSPVGRAAAAVSGDVRTRLREALRATLPMATDGSISYSARAVAFKARG